LIVQLLAGSIEKLVESNPMSFEVAATAFELRVRVTVMLAVPPGGLLVALRSSAGGSGILVAVRVGVRVLDDVGVLVELSVGVGVYVAPKMLMDPSAPVVPRIASPFTSNNR